MSENGNSKENQSPKKILVVDDSRAFLSGVKLILATENYETLVHTSAKQALSELASFRPDVIICDLEMPEMHGFDFIMKVRGEHGGQMIPILALTGNNDSEALRHSIICGADAFSSKESIRHTLRPQVLALLRLKKIHSDATHGKQLEAVQALIGTYKHEFGNTLAIMEGKLRKLEKTYVEIKNDPALESIKASVDRFKSTLKKLDQLRRYEEETYSDDSKIIKVS